MGDRPVYIRSAPRGNHVVPPQGTPLATSPNRQPDPRKATAVIDDPTSEDIRSLFDWRSAWQDGGQAPGTPVADDDLALALSLLSCNSRDREQFSGGRTPA
jgi:hypothetical protein